MRIVDKLRQMHGDMTHKVMKLTGLTHDQVMQIIFDTGVRYIERVAGSPISDEFLKEPLFWAWWKQQWALMDQVFIAKIPGHAEKKDLQAMYLKYHEDIDVYPDPVIWDQIHTSYMKMTEKVIRKEKELCHSQTHSTK